MVYDDEPATARDRLPAVLGIASVALLAAALRWAHHWGAVADLTVASWAAATLGALVVSLRSTDGPGRRSALLGWRWPASRSRPWSSPVSPPLRARIRPAPAEAAERDRQGRSRTWHR
jgi:hypothetical protein